MIPEGLVVLKEKRRIEHPTVVPVQIKKPKHLKRRVENAEKAGNKSLVQSLAKETEELIKIKEVAAKNFKKTCRKLVIKMYGDERWDPVKFDELLTAGIRGDKLLEILQISHEQQKDYEIAKSIVES